VGQVATASHDNTNLGNKKATSGTRRPKKSQGSDVKKMFSKDDAPDALCDEWKRERKGEVRLLSKKENRR